MTIRNEMKQGASDPPFLDDLRLVEPLLQATIGAQTRMVSYEIAKQQADYCVLLARLSHPKMEVVIKLAEPETRMASEFDRSASIYQLVRRHTHIPVPEPLAVDVSRQEWPWRFLILTCEPGTEWAIVRHQMDGKALKTAYRQLGEAIGQLHQIAFPKFGEIDASGQVLIPDLSCLAALRRRRFKLIQRPRLQDFFLAALERRSALFERVTQSRLCHEDLHGHNILFSRGSRGWQLAAILDFDKSWAGHVETDLARLEIWRGMTSPDFWAAYQELQTLEDGYTDRRPVYQLLWCLEYACPTQEHLADTQRVCQELGLPALGSFD